MASPLLIAQQDQFGAFTNIGSIALISSNTKLQVVETDGTEHTFSIPETGFLRFNVTVSAQTGGGTGFDYFIEEQTSHTDTSAIYEIKTSLALKLKLEASVEPVGLALKFIGEDEQDIHREIAGSSLVDQSEFRFQRKTSSIVMEVLYPSSE